MAGKSRSACATPARRGGRCRDDERRHVHGVRSGAVLLVPPRRHERPDGSVHLAKRMLTLVQIVIAAVAGGVLSTLAAAATLGMHSTWIPRFVSFAVGALLGAVFLELLPHALESGQAPQVMLTVLIGLLAFFLLEKLVLWRHAHGHDTHSDDRDESEHDHALHQRPAAATDGG